MCSWKGQLERTWSWKVRYEIENNEVGKYKWSWENAVVVGKFSIILERIIGVGELLLNLESSQNDRNFPTSDWLTQKIFNSTFFRTALSNYTFPGKNISIIKFSKSGKILAYDRLLILDHIIIVFFRIQKFNFSLKKFCNCQMNYLILSSRQFSEADLRGGQQILGQKDSGMATSHRKRIPPWAYPKSPSYLSF